MPNPWFRFYAEVLNDPKIAGLSDSDYRAWTKLLCIACRFNGRFPAVSETAFYMRMTEGDLATVFSRLCSRGLIDRLQGGVDGMHHAPHNWTKWQYKSDSSTKRVKRFRERFQSVSGNVSETPPDNRVQIREERKKDAAIAAMSDIKKEKPSEELEVFNLGKNVFGKTSGGLISKLIAAKNGNLALVRAAIEIASTKQEPREYIGAVIRGVELKSLPPWAPPGAIMNPDGTWTR